MGKMQTKVVRNSNLELLRILCMLFIVAHHFGVHGQYVATEMPAFNQFIVTLLSAGGKLGVNIYVLISGYFLIKSDFKPRRIISTLGLTFFYSITIYLALLIFVSDFSFSFSNLWQSIFVIFHDSYWFVTCYLVMILLSPFINKLINTLKEKEHLILIAILLLMQTSFLGSRSYIVLSGSGWFVTLYIISAYIRLYPKKMLENRLISGVSSIVFCTILGLWKSSTGMTNIICLLASISLFCFFNKLKIKKSRAINLIASTTFGIYLIHDNQFIRHYLWNVWLNCPFHSTLDNFWLFSAIAVITVFVGCSIIELVRIILTKPIVKLVKNKKESFARNKLAEDFYLLNRCS